MMKQYLDLLRLVQTTGNYKPSRGVVQSTNSSVGVKSIFGHQIRFDLQQGFPLVTTKTLSVHSIVHELLWFISGDTNTRYLKEHKVRIWDEWADENGDLGPVYGAQWRSWPTPDGGTIDQLGNLIAGIQKNPHGRRHIISAWNVAEIDKMKLPPCHVLSQFYVADGKLSCQLYQRSADLFLGVPFNIASYALLTHLVARVCGLDVGDFIHTFGDAHIYEIHDEQVALQLTRAPKKLPTLWLDPSITRIEDFKREHIRFDDYVADPKIAGEVVV